MTLQFLTGSHLQDGSWYVQCLLESDMNCPPFPCVAPYGAPSSDLLITNPSAPRLKRNVGKLYWNALAPPHSSHARRRRSSLPPSGIWSASFSTQAPSQLSVHISLPHVSAAPHTLAAAPFVPPPSRSTAPQFHQGEEAGGRG